MSKSEKLNDAVTDVSEIMFQTVKRGKLAFEKFDIGKLKLTLRFKFYLIFIWNDREMIIIPKFFVVTS